MISKQHFLLLILIMTFFTNKNVKADWEYLDSTISKNYSNGHMSWSNAEKGIFFQSYSDTIIGTHNYFKITNNGGLTWKTLDFDSLVKQNKLSFTKGLIELHYFNNTILALSYSKKYFKSTDNGLTWENYDSFKPNKVYIHINKKDSTVLTEVRDNNGGINLLRSDFNFKNIDTVQLNGELNNSFLHLFHNKNYVYGHINDGEKKYEFIRISGKNYEKYSLDFQPLDASFVDAKTGFMESYFNTEYSIYRTDDSGKVWSKVYSKIIPINAPVSKFLSPKIAYWYKLGENQLFASKNGCFDWHREFLPSIDSNIKYLSINDIQMTEKGTYLITGNKLYIDKEITTIKDNNNNLKSNFYLYPNPCLIGSNLSIKLNFYPIDIPKISLYSIDGKMISSINSYWDKETILCRIPDDIEQGIYLIGIRTGNEERYQKVIFRK